LPTPTRSTLPSWAPDSRRTTPRGSTCTSSRSRRVTGCT
jgi:hypothetical protein